MIEGFQFHSPTRILFGHGLVAELGDELVRFGPRKAMLVTDGVLQELGVAARVEASCKRSPTRIVCTFADVKPNASLGQVRKGIEQARSADVDLLIAVGGGSVIDTAKTIGLAISHGGDPMDYQGAQTLPGPCRPVVVVPTTAGTGSEVSNVAVVHDEANRVKILFVDNHLMPDLAVLDPDLTKGMGPRLTAATGMDALTHAVEAYVSTAAFPVSDALAFKAVEMIATHLLPAVCAGDDVHARGQMQMAAAIAGIAFTQAGVGCVHGASHALGGLFGLPHGEANAILLSFGMEYNLPECPDRFAELARALGVRETRGIEPIEAGRKAIERVRQLQTLLREHSGLPMRLSEVGVPSTALPEIASVAVLDGAMVYNRRPVDEQSIAEMLGKAY